MRYLDSPVFLADMMCYRLRSCLLVTLALSACATLENVDVISADDVMSLNVDEVLHRPVQPTYI